MKEEVAMVMEREQSERQEEKQERVGLRRSEKGDLRGAHGPGYLTLEETKCLMRQCRGQR